MTVKKLSTPIKLLIPVIVLVLLLSYCVLPVYAIDVNANDNTASIISPEDKVSALIKAQFEEAKEGFALNSDSKAEKTVQAAIWINDIDYDKVNGKAFSEALPMPSKATLGFEAQGLRVFEKNDFSDEPDQFTIEEVQEYIAIKRAEAKKMYDKQNKAYVKEKLEGKDIIFISSYSPVIIVNATYDEILEIASESVVLSIDAVPMADAIPANKYLNDTVQASSTNYYTMEQIKNQIRATYPISQGMNGAGVKVGIVELGYPTDIDSTVQDSRKHQVGPDIPEPDPNLPEDLREYEIDEIERENTHAKAVGDIILDIVPNISGGLQCASIRANNYNTYQTVELLLGAQVNIISQSVSGGIRQFLGYPLNSATYDDASKWYDHIAINHSVHVIVCAGNFGEYGSTYVSDYGLALNVITVGSVNLNSLNTYQDDDCSSFSSYNDQNYFSRTLCHVHKPDISAPGENIYVTGFNAAESGTSFATPIVTSVVAMLCQRRSALLTLQDTVKAIIAAGITPDYKLRYVPNYSSYGYIHAGAGMIDAQGAYYIAKNGRYVNSTISGAGATKTYTFSVSSSDTLIRVALAFIVDSRISGSHIISNPTITVQPQNDLDLEVLKNGVVIASSTTSAQNLEIVEFDPRIYGTGTYTIRVKQLYAGSTYFSVAWY